MQEMLPFVNVRKIRYGRNRLPGIYPHVAGYLPVLRMNYA